MWMGRHDAGWAGQMSPLQGGGKGEAMTIPIERLWSILGTREFMFRLMDPKRTPRVPAKVRREARQLIKHYPMSCDLENIWNGRDVDADCRFVFEKLRYR